MGEPAEHGSAARVNLGLAKGLENPAVGAASAWLPTVYFYVLVQLIEEAAHPDAFESNGARASWVRKRAPATRAAAQYLTLRDMSVLWRYEAEVPSQEDCGKAESLARAIARQVGISWPESTSS